MWSNDTWIWFNVRARTSFMCGVTFKPFCLQGVAPGGVTRGEIRGQFEVRELAPEVRGSGMNRRKRWGFELGDTTLDGGSNRGPLTHIYHRARP